ncbi:ribonuclease Y [Candidatus Aerophobetes bacterium]|nr:ribonuclease Y [Candidatus Aerophobetes bacterium]
MQIIIYILIGISGGVAIATFIDRFIGKSLLNKVKNKLLEADEEIKNKKREFELEKKEEFHRIRTELEERTAREREELRHLSQRLIEREELLDRRLQELGKKERKLFFKEKQLEEERDKVKILETEQRQKLEKLSGLSTEEAKKILLERVKEEIKEESTQIIRDAEKEAKEVANRKAQEIIATAIQRCAVNQVSELTVSTVSLPNDDMKGRVIGREGRNIRTFEALTGVDLIVDDTPETVVISCFDPLRRKIAEISLKQLIMDTRIHPARIEEIVEKAKKEVENIIKEEGEKVAFDMGISDLPTEIITLLGKLKFRTSFGQNALAHSKEVAYIAGMLASEIGVDSAQAKRAGLLHDIGKAVDQEMEGPHALIGSNIAEQYGEPPEIVHAIASHHEEKPAESVLDFLIQAADAISAARPGARKEVLEAYLKRLEKIEKIANSFPGIEQAYALRAGREVRILVQPEEIDDSRAIEISREIARKIKKEMIYPGQIKVMVIREFRSVEYAK